MTRHRSWAFQWQSRWPSSEQGPRLCLSPTSRLTFKVSTATWSCDSFMRFTSPRPCGLALLVVSALSHCSWEDGREIALRARAIAGQRLSLPSPLEPPIHDCAHESGCMCRGAIVAAALDASHCAAVAGDRLPIDFGGAAAPRFTNGRCEGYCWPCLLACHGPVIFGRQLRALYASLVI